MRAWANPNGRELYIATGEAGTPDQAYSHKALQLARDIQSRYDRPVAFVYMHAPRGSTPASHARAVAFAKKAGYPVFVIHIRHEFGCSAAITGRCNCEPTVTEGAGL